MISAVNPDGSTVEPLTIGNLASALNLANAKTTDDQGGTVTPTAVPADKAKEAVNGLLTQDGKDLSKAVTLADLQAVAVAGLNFSGNVGDNVHRKLTETLAIVGNKELFTEAKSKAEEEAQKAVFTEMGITAVPAEGEANKATYDEKYKAELEKQLTKANEAVTAKFSDKNVITETNKDNGEVSIKLAKKPEFEGIDVKDPTDDKKSVAITPDSMTVTKVEGDEPNAKTTTTSVGPEGTTITRTDKTTDPANPTIETAKYGIDGAEVKDQNGNKAEIKPTEIKLGKDGADGKDSVVLKAADDNNGGSVAVGNKDGEETIKLDGGNGTGAPTVSVKNNDGEKDSVTIKGADGTNGPSIDFA